MGRMGGNKAYLVLFLVIAALFAAACNLTSAPQEQLELTDVPTNTVLPTRTLIADGSAPTPVTVTSLPFPTAQRPTAIVVLPPTAILFPTSTPLPVSIAILSPVPGNTVAGNVQIYGAASHPNFLQYQLEWGPDPNPGNLWFLAGGVVQNPVINGMLGTWNSTAVQDGQYQLRLKVFLRDGTNLATVVNNIHVQNRIPTLVPSATTLPRPIAAFSVDRVSGQAPLVVRFFNQSSGNISGFSWNFGDGGSSSEFNPTHTFRNPGVFNVTLQVRGPGGTSNVSRQIVVQSSTPPVAGFTQDKTSGASPLTVQFTDQSQGNITQRVWNFGDATTSDQVNPSHVFTAVGTYNVILTVSGPGGSSSVTRQITVENPTIPEPIAALVPSQTEGEAPLTVQFDASDSSGQIDSYNWNFGDGKLGSGQIVTHTFADAGLYEVQLVVVGPGGQSAKQVEINVVKPPDAPSAGIAANPVSGNVPLTVNFDASSSTGPIDTYSWNFGDGAVGSGVTTPHTYNAAGTYTVELIVQGPGGSNSAFIEISAVEPIPAPKAAFDTTPASGPAPLDVQFTNQSEGEALTFEWTFGDGSPVSNDRDPLHRYEAAGDYEVTLKVTSPGGTDSASKTVTVTEPDAPPVAALDAFPVSGPAPLEVQFTNQTVGDNLTFEWAFGDGSPVSNERDPKHTFTAAGDFTVTLTVTGSGGSDSASITISATAPLPLPDASFTANPTSGEAPLTVDFDSTGDPNNISTYYWEFGDGATGDSADPQHIYAQANTYTARLTVSDANGRQSSSEMAISVSAAVVIAPPMAGFSVEPPTGTVGQPVQFTNTTTGDVTSYQWDFGDGNTATDASPQHTYTAPGNYPVILTATGPGGQNAAQASYSVAAAAQPPVAGFSVEPPTGTVGQPVQFTNTTTGDVTSYQWDFGDGNTATDASPQHTYTAPGNYPVILTATGPGGQNEVQVSYSVAAAAQPPVAGFSVEPPTGTVGQPVQFTNTTTGDVTSYQWDFGDGNTATDASPQHTYTAPGNYPVILTATGPGGQNAAQASYSVAAAAQPPVAGFSVEPPTGTVGQPVQFTNTTTGDVTSYQWDFGDGNTATDASPQHTYTAPGNYPVILTATGPGGQNAAQASYSVAAAAQPPVAGFSVEPPTGTVGQPVQFTNTTTGDVTSYQWDFGDGSLSDEPNPQHTYTAPGNYPVILTATGPGGQNAAQASYGVVPAEQPPVAGFSVEPPTGTVGQPVQFTNTTTGDVTSYQWDFGDGSLSDEASPQHTYTAPGNYPVILTATGPGGQNVAQASYGVVPAEQPPQPSIVDQIPVLPEIASQQVRNQLRAIFDSGTAQGKRAAVFTVIGGDMATQNGYLRPFADPGLSTGAPELQSIIDWYNQIDLGDGRSSFDHASAAASPGWRVQDLLDPGRSGGNCNGGETPLDCELRLVQPAVAVISVGLNDVGTTDPDTFRATLEQVLQVLLNNGVIPVVTTIQPNPNNVDAVRAINEALITAAQNAEAANGTVIPIYNLWRTYNQLPGSGLEGSTPTTAPSGPGILSSDAVGTYATNTRNSNVLTILDQLRSQVFPDASAG